MKEMTKRVLMTLTGVSVSGFSVGMFNFSVMGVDPFQVLMHGIAKHVPIDFGTLYMICNLVMLVAIFFADKKKIGLGTFINIFLLFLDEYFSEVYNTRSTIIDAVFHLTNIVFQLTDARRIIAV